MGKVLYRVGIWPELLKKTTTAKQNPLEFARKTRKKNDSKRRPPRSKVYKSYKNILTEDIIKYFNIKYYSCLSILTATYLGNDDNDDDEVFP